MAYIVIATANQHKVAEYRALLADPDVELKSLVDYPECPAIEENGTTFVENASIKALAAAEYCQSAAFADDSGLEVECLGGRPGIHSARYAPTSAECITKLLGEMAGQTNRRARFVCVIAIAFNGEIIETFSGELRGTIAERPAGTNGFGYDPIFIPDGGTRTLAEYSAEEKNAISHRADAFRKAKAFVDEELSALDGLI